jgi:hypothetical protein
MVTLIRLELSCRANFKPSAPYSFSICSQVWACFDSPGSSSSRLRTTENQGRYPQIHCWVRYHGNSQFHAAILSNDESACVINLPVLRRVLAPPARSCRDCNIAGFCAGALGGRVELRRLRVFLDCTANRKNVDLIYLGIACEPGSHSPCDYHSVQTSA